MELLENFVAQHAALAVESQHACATLIEKKAVTLQLHQQFASYLKSALKLMALPDFLFDFITQIWSQCLVKAALEHGLESTLCHRMQETAIQLVLSAQPKGLPILRKKFIEQLPALMKSIHEGLRWIQWSEGAQKDFLSKLLLIHAESLKNATVSELDHNLKQRDIQRLIQQDPRQLGSMVALDKIVEEDSLLHAEQILAFSTEEAQQLGLVVDKQIDWTQTAPEDLGEATTPIPISNVDIDMSVWEPLTQSSLPELTEEVNRALGPMSSEMQEITSGLELIGQLMIGFAYQMYLKDKWQKVRLSLISPGGIFFVFTYGKEHQQMVTLTARMLERLCEQHRLKAFESSYLMERAAHRARQQLAALMADLEPARP